MSRASEITWIDAWSCLWAQNCVSHRLVNDSASEELVKQCECNVNEDVTGIITKRLGQSQQFRKLS